MSYSSPDKQAKLPFNQSYSAYSPVATTTQRKPNQADQSQYTMGSQRTGISPTKNEVDSLLIEKNQYKQYYSSALQDLERANQEIRDLQRRINTNNLRQSVSPSRSPYRRELERSSPLRQSGIERSVREEALELELQRLRKQLVEKNVQVEEWMKRATRSEILAKGDFDLPEELNSKIQEIERLNRELTSLQLKSQDIGRLEREIIDLKALNKFKEEENERLRQEKTNIQLEAYKARQQEMNSKEAEDRLNTQVRILEQEQVENKVQQETYNKIRDQMHQEELKELKNSANLEKQILEKDLYNVEGLLRHKSREVLELSSQKNAVQGELAVNQAQLKRSQVTADVWRERASSAEKEVVYVQEQGVQEREALRQQMKKEQSIERMVLQDKIQTLQTIVSRKENELTTTQLTLAETNQKKREIELAKLRLQSAVEDLEAKNNVQQVIHRREQEAQRIVHHNEVNNLKKSHDFEKQHLNRSIDNLKYVADKTQLERDQEAIRAAEYQNRYLTSNEKARTAETQSQYWQLHSRNVERQKSIELQNADNLRRSLVDGLVRSHSREILQKEREKSQLVNTIVHQDSAVRNLQVENSLTKNDLIRKQVDLRNSQVEKSYYQNRLQDEQSARIIDNSIQNQLRATDNLRNSQELLTYQQVYGREISNLNSLVNNKQTEADIWRNSYHRASRY